MLLVCALYKSINILMNKKYINVSSATKFYETETETEMELKLKILTKNSTETELTDEILKNKTETVK